MAVIGLGSIGIRHATNFAKLGCRIIGSDADPDRLQMLDRIDGAASAATTSEAVEQADAVVIATPADSHVEIAEMALTQGRHVFIEKPLSINLHGTESLEELASDLTAMVGYNLRFLPALEKINSLVADGAIGRILNGQIEFGYDLTKWGKSDYRRTYSAHAGEGGGILLDAIHELDLLLWFAGPVESVVASIERSGKLEIDCEDTVAAIATTGDGALVSVNLDYLSPTYHRRVRLVGDEGAVGWDWNTGRIDFIRGEARADFNFPTDIDKAYVDEAAWFLSCLEGGSAPKTGIGQGIASLELAMAMRESAATGDRVFLGEQPDE